MSKERMQKQKEDTLRMILDKAWEIAVNEGFEAISIRKIAAAMNFAPNNLYNYFKNKNELLLCMKKDSYQWAIDVIEGGMNEIVSEDNKNNVGVCAIFADISKRLLHCALKRPERYVVMTSDTIMDDKEPLDLQLTDVVAAKIESGIASGELKECDPVITAVNIRMILIGFVRMVSSNKSVDIDKADEMLENLLGIIFDGIRKD